MVFCLHALINIPELDISFELDMYFEIYRYFVHYIVHTYVQQEYYHCMIYGHTYNSHMNNSLLFTLIQK